MGIIKQQFAKSLKRYRDKRDGATAIEFAILLVPFCALLFSIVELGVVFFIQATMGHAMQQASRDVRTGQLQATGGLGDAFHALVCQNMSGLGDCDKIRVDVITSNSGFSPDMLPDTVKGDPSDPGAPPPMPANQYDQTDGGDPVIIRVQYYYDLAFPGEYTRLANAGGNIRIIETVTAFRNEPF